MGACSTGSFFVPKISRFRLLMMLIVWFPPLQHHLQHHLPAQAPHGHARSNSVVWVNCGEIPCLNTPQNPRHNANLSRRNCAVLRGKAFRNCCVIKRLCFPLSLEKVQLRRCVIVGKVRGDTRRNDATKSPIEGACKWLTAPILTRSHQCSIGIASLHRSKTARLDSRLA